MGRFVNGQRRRSWEYWRLLPTTDELMIRRIRWYQSWARYPEAHQQVRASFSGSMGNNDTLSDTWDLSPQANPWALQLLEDLKFAYNNCEGFSEMAPQDYSLFKLFYLQDYRDWAFLDFSVMRSKVYSASFAPRGFHLRLLRSPRRRRRRPRRATTCATWCSTRAPSAMQRLTTCIQLSLNFVY